MVCNSGIFLFASVTDTVSWYNRQGRGYRCEKCFKMFGKLSHVRRHYIGLHTNIRYQCDLCDASYTQLSNLRSHRKKVHNVYD